MSLLGIDVGTSGCKTAVFSESGELLALAYEEYDYPAPAAGLGRAGCARGVGTGEADHPQGGCRSAGGDPVHGAVRVFDGRSGCAGDTPTATSWGRRCSTLTPAEMNTCPISAAWMPAERLYAINGNTLGSPYTLTKLMWLKQHQPDLYGRSGRSFCIGAGSFPSCSAQNRAWTTAWPTARCCLISISERLVGRTAGLGRARPRKAARLPSPPGR